MKTLKDNGIFKKGVLLKLGIHGVADTKRAKPNGRLLQEGIPSHLVYVNFKIIPSNYLNPVKQVENKVRDYIREREIKIDVPGFHYIPKSFVPEVVDTLKKFQKEYKEIANKWLIEKYDEWKAKIEGENPKTAGLIPKKDYLEKAFFIEYSFVELSPPSTIGDVLDKDLYGEELEKFSNTIDRAATLAHVGVREEMLGVVEDAVERLGYQKEEETEEIQKKIFRNTLVKDFQNFWNLVPRKNIFGDSKIEIIASGMQELLKGDIEKVSGKLRKENNFRINVHIRLLETFKEIGSDIVNMNMDYKSYIPEETLTRASTAAAITIRPDPPPIIDSGE